MCTHNQCFRAKNKNIIFFSYKNYHFYSREVCSILHGNVCVMFEHTKTKNQAKEVRILQLILFCSILFWSKLLLLLF